MKARFLAATALMASSLAPPGLAGDCWVAGTENRATGLGDAITAKHHAGLLAVLRRVAAVLKSDPAINAITGVRYRTHLYIGAPHYRSAPKSASASVYLHKPDMWVGACGLRKGADIVHFVELNVALNDLTSLGLGTDMAGDGHADADFAYAPRQVGQRGGYPIYENGAGNRVLLITAGGRPPLVPVTVGEYLDAWQTRLNSERDEAGRDLDQMAQDREWKAYITRLRKTDPGGAAELQRQMDEAGRLAREGAPHGNEEWHALQRLRTSLTPAQRAQPAYLDAESMQRHRFGYAAPGTAGAAPLVKPNPALWAGMGGESAVRTVALVVAVQDGDSTRESGADRWLERVDVSPYRALLGE